MIFKIGKNTFTYPQVPQETPPMWIEKLYGSAKSGGTVYVEFRELVGLPNEELSFGVQGKSWLANDGTGFHSKVPRVRKDFKKF